VKVLLSAQEPGAHNEAHSAPVEASDGTVKATAAAAPGASKELESAGANAGTAKATAAKLASEEL